MDDYYGILGVDKESSLDEIKAKYQMLIRKIHPDKLDANQAHFHEEITPEEHFRHVQNAWKTLSCEKLRKDYDTQMTQQKHSESVMINDEIDLEDMSCITEESSDENEDLDNSKQNVYSYPCRCGGEYVIYGDKLDLVSCSSTIISCENCSLHIRVCLEQS